MKEVPGAQKLISQGSEKSATSYAQALWEKERRLYFLRASEQVRKRKIQTPKTAFDLRKGRKPRPTEALLKALYEETPLNAHDIASFYGVSATTVRAWLDQCGIPRTRNGKTHVIRKKNFKRRKLIDGIPHKLCNGLSHDKPTWVPFKDFYRNSQPGHSADGIKGTCKVCDALRVGHPPMVPFAKVEFAVMELVHRLGINETARQIPLGTSTVWKYRNKKPKFIHRATAERILNALHSTRVNGVIRHADSIHHGASARGKPEKIPSRKRDFYNQKSDVEQAQRQALRRKASV